MVGFGRSCPEGHLPVFSVPTEEDAKKLLVFICPRSVNNQFVAPELTEEQTLLNLRKFSDRLQQGWDLIHKAE